MKPTFYLYKKSPKYPSETLSTVLLGEADNMEDILDSAMSDIFNELHDGDGENGGAGSLWRCAREIYDSLATGTHYVYADCEWWIEKLCRDDVKKTWTFWFSAVLDTSFTITDTSYERAKELAKKGIELRAASLREYFGDGLMDWQYDGKWEDAGDEETLLAGKSGK